MKLRWIFLEPSDVWLFRDARPFRAGEGHVAQGFFPPSPQTVAGALRSCILEASGIGWKEYYQGQSTKARKMIDLVGSPTRLDDSSMFSIEGPYLAVQESSGTVQVYVPFPTDAYLEKGEKDIFNAFCPLGGKSDFKANWPGQDLHPLWPPDGVRQEEIELPHWLDVNGLTNYLKNEKFLAISQPKLFDTEIRTGIALDFALRRPKEQMLYTARFTRPNQDAQQRTGLLVRVCDELPLPEKGAFSMGGEARPTRFTSLNLDQVPVNFSISGDREFIKLLLLTPAWFDGGWQPEDGDWSKILNQTGVDLISVALGRPQHLGGWDLASRHGHKTMYPYVPAGSVYFFKFSKPVNPLSIQARAYTQSPGSISFDRLGFGRVAVGTWKWQITKP